MSDQDNQDKEKRDYWERELREADRLHSQWNMVKALILALTGACLMHAGWIGENFGGMPNIVPFLIGALLFGGTAGAVVARIHLLSARTEEAKGELKKLNPPT